MSKKLIFLHGALGAATELIAIQKEISDQFEVEILEFEGHGETQLATDFSIIGFKNQLLAALADVKEPVGVFGFSMGGYVAILASLETNKIDKIYSLGTKFFWNPNEAMQETKSLEHDFLQSKSPKYLAYLQKIHSEINYKNILHSTRALMLNLGENPLLTDEEFDKIKIPVCIAVGDQDTMISVAQAYETKTKIKGSYLEVIPRTQHPASKLNSKSIALRLIDFFNG